MLRGKRIWTAGARSTVVATALAIAAPALLSTGCRVEEDNVQQWARKKSGPRKLVAVLQHDKYSHELRVEAGMTLITMKPRGGRAVGLLGGDDYIGLLEALDEMPPEERKPIVDSMINPIQKGLSLPLTEEGDDPTFAYKDGAYALLTHEGGSLIDAAESKKRLEAALVAWCQVRFEERMNDTKQLYGMEQLLRLLRADGVRGLTPLLEPNFKKIRELSKLIRELGDDATRLDASKRMVKVAEFVDSPDWIKQKSPAVAKANEKSGLKVTERQFEKQLEAYQEEELTRVFGAMKFVGKKPIVNYLIAYAKKTENPEKRRAGALAALENNLEPKSEVHAQTMLDFLANDETPDSIRDVAARRVGELSRAQVAARLFELFDNKRWQVRWTAASLLLKMSEAKHMDEFMDHLGKVKRMSMTEPLAYGPLLTEVKGEKTTSIVEKYSAKSQPVSVRLSALGYYYQHGTKADLAKVEPLKADATRVPSCPKDAEGCAWECGITENGKRVSKTVRTLGNYVEYCLIPAMTSRDPVVETTDEAAASAKTTEKKN